MTGPTVIAINNRHLRLSNLEKVLYPATGFTKGDVVTYYLQIAETILPHVHNRPVSLKRYPDGVDAEFFFQKNCPDHRPDWVPIASMSRGGESEGSVHFCVIDDAATLVWMANLASIEVHTYLATADDFDRPTLMVFDLDPGPGADALDCARVAIELRELLDHVQLRSFPKTSGAKGLHLAVPLNSPVTYEQTKSFSRALAGVLARRDSKRVTATMTKSERPGRVFVDWSQNDRHKTTVSVYSLRATERPSVSTPVTWDELDAAIRAADPRRLVFGPDDVHRRIDDRGDIFAPVANLRQSLPKFDVSHEAESEAGE